MQAGEKRQKAWNTIFIAGAFLAILTGARFLWIGMFYNPDQPQMANGLLDLRGWNADSGRVINLDGQWEFFPGELLDDSTELSAAKEPQLIQVPGNWNEALQEAEGTSYGYGTYRMRIVVNPELDYAYGIRMASVRSSSHLYVNGELLAGSGEPGADKNSYTANNLPYTAYFSPDESGVIEVIVQAANYIDPRAGGIVRSIKFGVKDALSREVELSVLMQQVAAVVLILHAAYAVFLYFAGTRERSLIYLALVFAFAMIISLYGNDDKILHYWIPVGYEWGFKLVELATVGLAYFILLFIKRDLTGGMHKLFVLYSAVCAISALSVLLLPVRYSIAIQAMYMFLLLIAVVISILAMILTSIRETKDNMWMLLAFIALASNLLWIGVSLSSGIKVVYYPFDLIITIGCFAITWLKDYFQVHDDTKKLAAKLQKADKLKDEFLAQTSHELRNPLHGMLNMSQAVLEREHDALSPKSVNDLENVLSVGRRMSLMLNDLLDAMSLKQSATRLHQRSFAIGPIAAGVLDMLRFMTEGKPVRLVNHIPEHFPQVFADENRVIQIMYNLLHNSVKFTNEGEITIRAFVENGRAHIAVSDTGIGMDAATMQHIFDPYEQGSSVQPVYEGGFGLGLSICKQLIELHGGSIRISSKIGKGSEFIFTLQLSEEKGEEETTEASSPAEEMKSSAAEAAVSGLIDASQEERRLVDRPRILIIDDDPVNLNVLESILSIEKYDITTATSAGKALEVLDAKEWDLVISDVMMPQMSGYELTRVIRKRFSLTELPILLLTARSQPEDIENGFMSGANDYVTKPVDALELRSRVKALTAVKQSVRDQLQMEAAWLQAQIQPHFLFNTLNSVSALSAIDLDRMQNLIEALSSFLRSKFQIQSMDGLVSAEEELSIVRSYLYIEQVRYEERLKVEWEIDDCKELRIPPLTIQPLVENAIRHGIMKRASGGRIVIRVKNYETCAEISVIDDGVGMDAQAAKRLLDRSPNSRSGVGLINTDLRLKRCFGKGLKFVSKPGAGMAITFIAYK